MSQRYLTIWFCYLKTDWFTRRNPPFGKIPFVVYASKNGRMIITAANSIAERKGIRPGMVLADANAIFSPLESIEDKPELFETVLQDIAKWFIRFSPVVASDPFDGIIINATGCAHLFGGERKYLEEIVSRMKTHGYSIKIAMASTIGAAWAVTRYGTNHTIIESGKEWETILPLPPESLRILPEVTERLHKLGLHQIKDFISMKRNVVERRFGKEFILSLNKALGHAQEYIHPVEIPLPFVERLQCMEPIVTRTGIEIALQKLIEKICISLFSEHKGLRNASLAIYRIDGKTQQIDISVNRPTNEAHHIFNLFELKIGVLEPGLGIELFILKSNKTEDHLPAQEEMWSTAGLNDHAIIQLLDRLTNKIGEKKIHRYIPGAHYWPERSFTEALTLDEKSVVNWAPNKTRPVKFLLHPEPIAVTAPVPDYPPMLFRHRGKLHSIKRAEGPERIEQEWWLQEGQHRDYYYVEDQEGCRFWLFRAGHYNDHKSVSWYLHGYCA